MKGFLIVLMVLVISSCVRNKSGNVLQESAPVKSEKVFEVIEVLQANSYTYMKVKENFEEKWMAVTKRNIEPGEVYYYDAAMKMIDFESNDLDRTFEEVYLVQQISKEPIEKQTMDIPAHGHSGSTEMGHMEISVDKSEGELTLASVFENKKKYSAETFEIRGIVVKYSPYIMGKNWVHIQDGSEYSGVFDLTITTQSEVKEGDEVTFKGKLSLDKDFGYGYAYEVIMEDADLVDKKEAEKSL